MKYTIIVVVGLTLAATLPALASQAANTRSFVSPTGSDSNDCTLAAPCRSFQGAYNQTIAGGEIAVLGTAGYGTLTIMHAISIVNPGGFEAGVAVPFNGTGITVNAGPSDAVSLRGLTIEGGGVGAIGIQFNTGQSLTIDNCVVRHLVGGYPQGTGIEFVPSTTSSLLVSNSVMSDNQSHGIVVYPNGASGAINAVVDHVQANNNAFGLFVGADNLGSPSTTLTVTVSDSVVASNINVGVYARGQGAKIAVVNIFRSVIANSAFGVQTLSASAIYLAQSMLTGDNTAFDASQGAIYSWGDNYILNFNVMGSLTPVPKL